MNPSALQQLFEHVSDSTLTDAEQELVLAAADGADRLRACIAGDDAPTPPDMRAQLNCARIYLGPTVGGELSFAWYGLSRATHHHPYELDPTAEELRSLIGLVERAGAAVTEAARARHVGV